MSLKSTVDLLDKFIKEDREAAKQYESKDVADPLRSLNDWYRGRADGFEIARGCIVREQKALKWLSDLVAEQIGEVPEDDETV